MLTLSTSVLYTIPIFLRLKDSARPPTYEEWLSKIKGREKKSADAIKKVKRMAKDEEAEKLVFTVFVPSYSDIHVRTMLRFISVHIKGTGRLCSN